MLEGYFYLDRVLGKSLVEIWEAVDLLGSSIFS